MKWFSTCLVATGVLLFVSACHEVSSSCNSNNTEIGEQIYDTRLVGKVDNRQVFAFCYRSSEYIGFSYDKYWLSVFKTKGVN